MKNRVVAAILFVLFLLEGTLVQWMLPVLWLAPHFTLVVILMVSIVRNRHIGLLFGLVFGLIHDIVYASPMIGVHGFGMALAAYCAGVAAKRIKMTMTITFIIVSLSIVIHDIIVFSLYRLFRVTVMEYGVMLTKYLTTALLFNLLFAVLIYVPVRKWLEMKAEKHEDAG